MQTTVIPWSLMAASFADSPRTSVRGGGPGAPVTTPPLPPAKRSRIQRKG